MKKKNKLAKILSAVGDNVQIIGDCTIGENVKFVGGCVVEDSHIGDNCTVFTSNIKKSEIGKNCTIGPFANLREGTVTEENVKVGAFVEIKNSKIGKDSKVPHHIYVGDAVIGQRVNIGCGVVFANFDGKEKRQSIIGDDVFIGSNVNIVAPVNIASGTYICAGTTVTKDTEENDFVIGRVRQENKKR